ncbi:hypothetical protein BH18ACT4_BH18ACT4_11160 [soil metagenome]
MVTARRRGRSLPLRRLVRTPVVYWAVTATLAAATGVAVAQFVGDAAEARSRWGSVRAVAVVTEPVGPGEVIGGGDVTVRDLPAAVVPGGAMSEEPVCRVATVQLHPGEMVLTARVAPDGLQGVAALLPKGSRGVAVPTGPGTPPLSVGDLVDVLVTVDPTVAEGEPTFTLTEAAVVVAVEETGTTVAVPAYDAPAVAFAVTSGTVTLALTGSGAADQG